MVEMPSKLHRLKQVRRKYYGAGPPLIQAIAFTLTIIKTLCADIVFANRSGLK